MMIQAHEGMAGRLVTEQQAGTGTAQDGPSAGTTKDKTMTMVVMALDRVTAYL